MEYRIGKFLDASTDTITEKDMEILAANEETPTDVTAGRYPALLIRVITHAYGWWINVQHAEADGLRDALATITEHEFSDKFKQLFQVAAANQCDWINLDRDA